jgi:hypothetical protein
MKSSCACSFLHSCCSPLLAGILSAKNVVSSSTSLRCFSTLGRKNRAVQVMQCIEDTNESGLVCQTTRQDRHRTMMRIVRMLDRHVIAISGPLLVQGAQDPDPVDRRFKPSAWAGFFHHPLLGSLSPLASPTLSDLHAPGNYTPVWACTRPSLMAATSAAWSHSVWSAKATLLFPSHPYP